MGKKVKTTVSKPPVQEASDAPGTATQVEVPGASADSPVESVLSSEADAQIAALTARLTETEAALALCQADKAAVETERDQAKAALAQVSARLELSIEERMRLGEQLAAALDARPALATDAKPAVVLNGPSIRVRTRDGRKDLRYRAGRAFGPEASSIALAELTGDQLDALKGDPELVVTDQSSQEA